MSCQFYFWAELCEILQLVVPSSWKPFFPRLTEKHWRAKQYIIYICIYIYIKQFQEATTTTPTIHGPSEKSNNLAQHLAGEMEYPPRRRRGRVSSCGRAGRAGTEDAAQDQDGKGPRAAAVEGWWNSYISIIYIYIIYYIYIVYIIYIYIIYHYMILYVSILILFNINMMSTCN